MELRVGVSDGPFRLATDRLLYRMLSPMSGLSTQIGFVTRSALEPRIAIASGEVTGAHRLAGQPAPTSYHISGTGMSYDEALIAVLAETIERYVHVVPPGGMSRHTVYASFRDMAFNSRALVPENLQYFSEDQLAQAGFPFSRAFPDTTIGWSATESLIDGSICWIPAQIARVGYIRQPNEPPIMAGVSTGTAAHTEEAQALKNAVLELIEIDAAMGNWYGNAMPIALKVGEDSRTQAVESLIRRHLPSFGPKPRFYWLPSPDLPGLTIACVFENDEIPEFVVGLGCDLRLAHALYKAFLEAVAVAKLAKLNVLRLSVEGVPHIPDSSHLYDLDTNVAYYALTGREAVDAKFSDGPAVSPSELPNDVDLDTIEDVRYLIDCFRHAQKELVFLDLTTEDVRELGFIVARVWSPDTLSLSLPSAPPKVHPRFQAYGGVTSGTPHPYP